ncbi:hypothetical protein HK100_004617 [Physocladia obscura]|uniref:Tail specific protease domain-containing protein n=1 Tax=Physocladia obscura TaxID=109957 RepID=A0AAD5SUU7_9FUNG|nr:hypothetical protein HK100_004617 [Physocladia obscura]
MSSAISPDDVDSIVSVLASKVRANYIKIEDAGPIAVSVETAHAAGLYNDLSGDDLAAALTKDLQAINGDKHLRVKFDADHVAEEEPPTEPKKYNDDGQIVDDDGNVIQDTDAPPPAFLTMFTEMSKDSGNGISGVEVLPGNIGYVSLSLFAPEDLSKPFFQYAMSILQYTNALIIDIRGCIGGDSSTELISYFTSERVHFKNIFWRPENRLVKEYTSPIVPGPRYNGAGDENQRPVYILTGKGTFSSAEAFAFFMHELNLAKTVGETTAGGGNPCRFFKIGHDHFVASISVGKTYSPKTGKGWEAVGVPADYPCNASDAKDFAHLLGCMVTLEKLQTVDKSKLSPAKGALLKKTQATVQTLEKKLEESENVKPAADASVEESQSEQTNEPEIISSLGFKDGHFKELSAGIHSIKNEDGSVSKVQRGYSSLCAFFSVVALALQKVQQNLVDGVVLHVCSVLCGDAVILGVTAVSLEQSVIQEDCFEFLEDGALAVVAAVGKVGGLHGQRR